MDNKKNLVAWQPSIGEKLEIKQGAIVAPKENEILVHNKALAVNPADWILQGQAIGEWMTYPLVLGNDVAGIVTEIGESVTRFKVGDRVIGQAMGCWENSSAKGGFQHYTILDTNLVAHIPDSMLFTEAVVLPLGISTASCGLFQYDHLGLNLPTEGAAPIATTILVWGGASSVGSCAIQLAATAGYDVITTASPKNFEAMKALGAKAVFDYKNKSVVDQVTASIAGKAFGGVLFAVGNAEACYEVVQKLDGNRFISSTLPIPMPLPKGVRGNQIFGGTLKDNFVGKAIYEDFLGSALADGRFSPSPKARIIGQGLSLLQRAIDIQKSGVSAEKIVVSLA